VQNLDSKTFLELMKNSRRQGFTGGNSMPHARQIKLAPCRGSMGQKLHVVRGHGKEQRRPVPFDGVKHILRTRRPRQQNTGSTCSQREIESVSQSISKKQLCHAEESIVLRDFENGPGVAFRAHDHVVLQVNTTLWLPRAAG